MAGRKKKPKPLENEAVESPPTETGRLKSPDDPGNLKCYRSEAELIGRAAGVRYESVADLLRSPEVRRFFLHLIIAAGRQAEESLEEEGQSPT